MKDKVRELKTLCEAHGLRIDEPTPGHFQISGHGALVNYWPLSKKRKAHIPGQPAVAHCLPYDVLQLALGAGKKVDLIPEGAKKTIANKRGSDPVLVKPKITNPADIRHFYTGEVPPWDDSLFRCMAASDLYRIGAYNARCEAERRAYMANEMDRVGNEQPTHPNSSTN